MDKKTVRVVCAIFIKDGKVFAAQRDYGEFKGLWEFPGGKIEPGETPEQAIVREIKEELGTDISVKGFFMNERYEYATFVLDMDCFFADVSEGSLNVEKGIHADEMWVKLDKSMGLSWCPADREIFENLVDSL